MLLDIKKVGENFYLVNGEYTASSFNEAVIIANKGKKIKGLTYSSEQFAWADEYSFVKIIAKKPAKTDYTYTEGYLNLLPNDRYYVLAKLRFGNSITYRPVPVTYEEFLRLKNSEVGTSFQPLK